MRQVEGSPAAVASGRRIGAYAWVGLWGLCSTGYVLMEYIFSLGLRTTCGFCSLGMGRRLTTAGAVQHAAVRYAEMYGAVVECAALRCTVVPCAAALSSL